MEEQQCHLRVHVEERKVSCFHCGNKGNIKKGCAIWLKEQEKTKSQRKEMEKEQKIVLKNVKK